MKKFLALLSVPFLAFSLAACSQPKEDQKQEETQPKQESKADEISGNISTNGSTSMESVIGILSEKFMADHPDVKITYDATGSGTGIESVNTNSCDIGLASRNLKDEEVDKGLVSTTVALDGIAVIVNENSPIDNLSLEDVAAVFTGEKTEIGDFKDISAIGREAGSGTRDGFESITETKDKCKLAQELTSTGAVIEAVKNNPNAIGYASFSSVEGKNGVKMLKVDDVDCTFDNIANGSYKIQRPFNLVTKKDTALNAQSQAFFDFMTSADAGEFIKQAGAVPNAK